MLFVCVLSNGIGSTRYTRYRTVEHRRARASGCLQQKDATATRCRAPSFRQWGSSMTHLSTLVVKLRAMTKLGEDDIAAIEALPIQVQELAAHSSILVKGSRPSQCCLMIEGFSARSQTTDDGKRQILSIHIPGDMPDLQSLHLHVMDHDLRTLSDCTLGFIAHDALRALARARPMIAEALWRETLVDAAIFRAWIVNLGRRPANQRLAHLLLEIRRRLELVGLATDDRYELPMTQLDLADALGLTPVHMNRVLKALRSDGLLDVKKFVVKLGDAQKLMTLGDFDDLYLHQNPEL
jgi:CRP-like cAMP-binding protein